MRQIVLDTETTGLEVQQGHRIIEIGCVELVDRRPTGRVFHRYLNPGREIDAGAIEVHGLTNEFLAEKPLFTDIAAELVDFLRGAQLVIHNAAFDVSFLDAELERAGGYGRIAGYCDILDTLLLARRQHPGQRNSLDALCKRYDIDNSQRTLHGALLDAEILADVYLAMTGGQTALMLGGESGDGEGAGGEPVLRRLPADRPPLRVIAAGEDELAAHAARLGQLAKASGKDAVWVQLEAPLA